MVGYTASMWTASLVLLDIIGKYTAPVYSYFNNSARKCEVVSFVSLIPIFLPHIIFLRGNL